MNKKRFDFLKKDYVQGFPAFCGFQVEQVAYGVFETRLEIGPDHWQQDGFVHAGVIATMADHTGGYAAYTTVSEETRILTIEFKINYFRPAKGEAILCRSRVVNRGKTIIVSESEVFSLKEGEEKSVSKAMITLMAVPASQVSHRPRE
ncbi:MAG: PaaI family thioesterase [Thermodesulfobacteriota bacterium]|nr:PaaI family thioesterase [Thermodesulfobacteriota bacterium]